MTALSMLRRLPRQTLVVVVIGAVLVLGPATAALADATGPTNYHSQVLGLQPAVDGVDVDVLGGDAFLHLTVQAGHTVVVYGYGRGGKDEEPYLRFEPDGTVLANLNSPAYYLNEDRYAAIEPPASASVDADPDWSPVAADGSYAWHDHRIHWMSHSPPPAIRGRSDKLTTVFDWSVPIEVDGTPVTVNGQLTWIPSTAPLAPAAVGLLLLAGVVTSARRAAGLSTAGLAALIAATVAAAIAAGEANAPGMTSLSAAVRLVPVVLAALAALTALAVGRRRPGMARLFVLLAGGLVMLWALPHLGALTKPVLPNPLPNPFVRYGLAAAMGLAAGAFAAPIAYLQPGSVEDAEVSQRSAASAEQPS